LTIISTNIADVDLLFILCHIPGSFLTEKGHLLKRYRIPEKTGKHAV